jgi:hypothetical protein
MKITKRMLREMIEEESKILDENVVDQTMDEITAAVGKLLNYADHREVSEALIELANQIMNEEG